jgi:hypothetical protein
MLVSVGALLLLLREKLAGVETPETDALTV